ncbi:MAG: hypothetical protein FWC58_10485 [Desulfobulbus sp.]|nr:hypothetical protein [Desulfobulbus sp.]
MPITQKKQGFSFFRAAIAIVVLIAVYQVVEAILFPWARSLTGAPTLTGEWMGEMTTASGRHFLIWMELGHSTDGAPGARRTFNLDGAAQTCEATGEQRRYSVMGNTENIRGTVFWINMLPQEKPEQRQKLILVRLNGQWSGDRLEIDTQLLGGSRDATGRWALREIEGDPDTRAETRWHMQRGTEKDFQMKCSSIQKQTGKNLKPA